MFMSFHMGDEASSSVVSAGYNPSRMLVLVEANVESNTTALVNYWYHASMIRMRLILRGSVVLRKPDFSTVFPSHR